MTTNHPTPVELSEADVDRIEAQAKAAQLEPHAPDEWWADIPALCATVRALRKKHSQLGKVSAEWASLLDRIRAWSKCADGYPLDEHINNIATRLAQVEQERNDLRSSLDTERRAVNVLAGEIKP